MSNFKLDTSGNVSHLASAGDDEHLIIRWPDLSPFVQGYVEAAFADFGRWLVVEKYKGRILGFSDLAPETLARIMEYCRSVESGLAPNLRGAVQGRDCWRAQSVGLMTTPAFTLYLSDDGKVHLREGR